MKTLALAALLAAPAAALPVPPLTGRVVDRAGLLSETAAADVDAKLRAFERKTGHQLAVLTIPSLEGEVLESYSLKVARAWALGRKGVDDGILLLISRDDRKLRIEVGHGLEGSLPDALAGRIIADEIAPRFKEGNYASGVDAGVDAIVAICGGGGSYRPSPAPSPAARRAFPPRRAGPPPPGKWFLAAGIFGLLGVFEIIGLIGPSPWFIYFFMIPFWAAHPAAFVDRRLFLPCLLGHLIGFPLVRRLIPRTEFGRKFRVEGSKTYWGDTLLFTEYGGGGGGSSDSGGFSSGGDSFSGGGGSFGGGGASGSW